MSRLVWIVVAVLFVVLLAGAGGLWLVLGGDAGDKGKARATVQRYYDARFPGGVDVRSCDFARRGFVCEIRVICRQAVRFISPRVDQFVPSPTELRPASAYSARPACAAAGG